MGYDMTQKETLEIAWKRGYLSNTKHYTLLEKLTGLNRKQISNWARTQIRRQGSAPLPSINRDPAMNTGNLSDSKRFLDIAWERGLLPGTENYTLIQDFTNLSRKQISNWSRTRVRKMERGQLNENSASQTFQTIARTPRPTRKRSLKPKREKAAKKRLTVAGTPELSRAMRWLLMNAVNGVAFINEEKVGLLSTLIGYPRDEVRKFLQANGRSVEGKGDNSADQLLPLMEANRLVPEQQESVSLQTGALAEPDKPTIKKEDLENSKENMLSPATAAAPPNSLVDQSMTALGP